MSRKHVQYIQDSVHGLMAFSGMETAIVELLRARELQRLRRIRQLGLAYLVFPGAEHSRLAHSLGAAHIALRYAEQLRKATRDFLVPFLQPDDAATRDLGIAALVHDLGTGPFSHAWEHEVVTGFDRDAQIRAFGLEKEEAALRNLPWHELVTQGLLNWSEGDLYNLLEQHEKGTSKRIRNLLLKKYYLSYLPRLLSSDVDVDRSDFILRDGFMAGVSYGNYDINWLISTVRIGVLEDDSLTVGFDIRKAPRAIEQFILARRALYDMVYYHKAVKIAEAMLGLLLRRLKQVTTTNGWPLKDDAIMVKALNGCALTPREVLTLDDYTVWNVISSIAETNGIDETLTDLAKRVVVRDLFKFVPCNERKLLHFIKRKEDFVKIEQILQKYIGGKDPAYYYYLSKLEVKLLSSNSKERAYFVDTTDSAYRATPIDRHPQLQLWAIPQLRVALYAPKEAVSDLVQLIGE